MCCQVFMQQNQQPEDRGISQIWKLQIILKKAVAKVGPDPVCKQFSNIDQKPNSTRYRKQYSQAHFKVTSAEEDLRCSWVVC